MTTAPCEPIKRGPHGEFSIRGECFVVDTSEGRHRRPSGSEAFRIVKNEPYIQIWNLLFEQIMLMGSTSLIAEIRVWKPLYLIRKAVACERPIEAIVNEASTPIFDQILSRGKKLEWI